MDQAALRRAVRTKLTVPKYQDGRALGWGRRATDAAVRSGKLPVIEGPKEVVSTAWLRRQLQLEEETSAGA
jgi:hypothetical protein